MEYQTGGKWQPGDNKVPLCVSAGEGGGGWRPEPEQHRFALLPFERQTPVSGSVQDIVLPKGRSQCCTCL